MASRSMLSQGSSSFRLLDLIAAKMPQRTGHSPVKQLRMQAQGMNIAPEGRKLGKEAVGLGKIFRIGLLACQFKVSTLGATWAFTSIGRKGIQKKERGIKKHDNDFPFGIIKRISQVSLES